MFAEVELEKDLLKEPGLSYRYCFQKKGKQSTENEFFFQKFHPYDNHERKLRITSNVGMKIYSISPLLIKSKGLLPVHLYVRSIFCTFVMFANIYLIFSILLCPNKLQIKFPLDQLIFHSVMTLGLRRIA